jgi:hypothetical protein
MVNTNQINQNAPNINNNDDSEVENSDEESDVEEGENKVVWSDLLRFLFYKYLILFIIFRKIIKLRLSLLK